MKKSFLILIVLIALNNSSEAQTGYLGKRLALKINALSGRERLFSGFEIEYVVKRNLTFCAGYRSSNYLSTINFSDFENINNWINSYSNNLNNYYFNRFQFSDVIYSAENANNVEPGYKINVSDGKLISARRIFDFSFRLYSNSYLSAPSGFYTQYGFGFGSQSYNGGIYYPNDIREIYDGNSFKTNFYKELYERYTKKERLYNMYIGIGYQHIFSKWITLDFNINAGIGFIGNSNNIKGSQFTNNNFALILDEQKDFSRIGNLIGNGSSSSSTYNINEPLSAFYISGFLKLGILIF